MKTQTQAQRNQSTGLNATSLFIALTAMALITLVTVNIVTHGIPNF